MRELLYVTQSCGYRHEVLPYSQQVMAEIGMDSGYFHATCTDDVGDIDWEKLDRWSVIAFCTTGELPIPQQGRENLLRRIESGGGFLGIHNATDTFYDWPQYGEMLGGYFDGHPWHQEVGVVVEDRDHPATRHLPDRFTIHDEIYIHKDWSRHATHVLMRLDNDSVDVSKVGGKRPDEDFALAWQHPYGAGRVFYTALGHGEPTWSDPLFHQHLLGAIEWLCGKDDVGSYGGPSNAPPEPDPR